MSRKLWIGLAIGTLFLGAVPAWAATRNVPGTYPTIQAAITAATAGDTILVAEGTYVETGQISINKDLFIIGADKNTVIIKPSADTGSSGDDQGWWLITENVSLNLSNVTLDGIGRNIMDGIRFKGNGSVANSIIKNITYPDYNGYAISMTYEGTASRTVLIENNQIINFGRVGVYMYKGTTGATTVTVRGNTITGEGSGDYLNNAVEVEGGALAIIENNNISNCLGVASSDGSTSIGIVVTTYFDPGTAATITGNNISNCITGITVGYDGSDTSTVTVHQNNITGNTYGVTSTAPEVNATNNWWGDNSGPSGGVLDPVTSTPANGTGDNVSANVHFDPWLGVAVVGAETKEIPASTTETVQNGELGIGADVTTNGNGSSTVTLAKYSANPSGIAFNGSFYDLSISDTGNVNQIILKLYYNELADTNVSWFNGSAWVLCSNQAVVAGTVTIEGVTYNNRVEVTINNTTTPSLNDLKGTFFALATPQNPTGDSGSLPVGPLAVGISAFLVWWKRWKQNK